MTYMVIQIINGRNKSQTLVPPCQATAVIPFYHSCIPFFSPGKEKLDIERQVRILFQVHKWEKSAGSFQSLYWNYILLRETSIARLGLT